jgi:hypothetical protein
VEEHAREVIDGVGRPCGSLARSSFGHISLLLSPLYVAAALAYR